MIINFSQVCWQGKTIDARVVVSLKSEMPLIPGGACGPSVPTVPTRSTVETTPYGVELSVTAVSAVTTAISPHAGSARAAGGIVK